MSAPHRVNDGDFTTAKQVGEGDKEYPFINQGDATAWIYKAKMRIDQASFSPLASMAVVSTPLGNGYLVEPENPVGIGQGLVEWTRTVANVPATRTIPNGTISYNSQIEVTVASVPVVPYEIEEVSFTVDSYATYNYSLTPFTPVQAPRIFSVFRGLTLVNIGGWGTFTADDPILAIDGENSLYRGLIYQQKLTYIRYPYSTPT